MNSIKSEIKEIEDRKAAMETENQELMERFTQEADDKKELEEAAKEIETQLKAAVDAVEKFEIDIESLKKKIQE